MYIRKNESRVEFDFFGTELSRFECPIKKKKDEKPRKKVGNETVTVTSYWEFISR